MGNRTLHNVFRNVEHSLAEFPPNNHINLGGLIKCLRKQLWNVKPGETALRFINFYLGTNKGYTWHSQFNFISSKRVAFEK